jgi:hypothetical protein
MNKIRTRKTNRWSSPEFQQRQTRQSSAIWSHLLSLLRVQSARREGGKPNKVRVRAIWGHGWWVDRYSTGTCDVHHPHHPTPLHHLLYKEAAETAETVIKTKQKQKQQVCNKWEKVDRLLQKLPYFTLSLALSNKWWIKCSETKSPGNFVHPDLFNYIVGNIWKFN